MAIYAVVDRTGVIINRAIVDDPATWTAPDGFDAIEELEPMQIGGRYADGVYTPPPQPDPPPPLVPASISDRQFFQQLAIDGIITQDDALASNAAVIPPALMAIITAMPSEQQFAAKMLVSGATVFERSHPMTAAIGAAYGWTSEQIDAFFQAAAQL